MISDILAAFRTFPFSDRFSEEPSKTGHCPKNRTVWQHCIGFLRAFSDFSHRFSGRSITDLSSVPYFQAVNCICTCVHAMHQKHPRTTFLSSLLTELPFIIFNHIPDDCFCCLEQGKVALGLAIHCYISALPALLIQSPLHSTMCHCL